MPVFTSSIELSDDYPTIEPSLKLNFARSRSLDPRITFKRGSTATYVGSDGLVKSATHHEPRFDHDPITGESLGLLIEEERTNYCPNSEMLANWAFGVGTDTFTASSGDQLSANPDGSSPAFHYSPSSTPGYHRFNRGVTLPTLDTNYVVSVFVKRVTAGNVSNLNRYVELEATGNWNGNTQGTGQSGTNGGSAVTFDMENLVIQSRTDNTDGYVGDARIENYGNGWYRLSYVFNPGIGSNFTGQVWWGHPTTLGSDGGGETGNGDPSFYFWGASVENGSFITSHIPTPANSSVTRVQDSTRILGEEFKKIFNTNFSEFSVVMDYNNLDTVASGTSNGLVLLWGESTNFDNRLSVSSDDDTVNTAVRVRAFGGGSGIFSNNDGVAASSQAATQKLAFSWSVPNYGSSGTRRWAFSFSGESVDVITNNNGSTVPLWTRLGIGINPTRDDESGGKLHVKRFAIYPKAVTDAQLQLLSA